MTKKDYILIANALKPFYQGSYSFENYKLSNDEMIISMVQAISKALSQDNPKFNPVRFLDMIRQ